MLTQTVEYALRAMACLAFNPDELTPTPTLAEQTKVPASYLAKVLQMLSAGDLISGRRGVGGGYKLTRPPEDISLLDVINVVDPVERIESCPLGITGHDKLCPLHHRLDQAAKMLMDLFGSASLADLIKDAGSSIPLCDDQTVTKLRVKK